MKIDAHLPSSLASSTLLGEVKPPPSPKNFCNTQWVSCQTTSASGVLNSALEILKTIKNTLYRWITFLFDFRFPKMPFFALGPMNYSSDRKLLNSLIPPPWTRGNPNWVPRPSHRQLTHIVHQIRTYIEHLEQTAKQPHTKVVGEIRLNIDGEAIYPGCAVGKEKTALIKEITEIIFNRPYVAWKDIVIKLHFTTKYKVDTGKGPIHVKRSGFGVQTTCHAPDKVRSRGYTKVTTEVFDSQARSTFHFTSQGAEKALR